MILSSVSYIHNTLLACAATLMLFFSFVLLYTRLSILPHDAQYLRSRKLMGQMFLTAGMLFLLLWSAAPFGLPSAVACAWNIMCVHFGSILLVMSLMNLLEPAYLDSSRIRRDFGCWGLNVILLWVAALLLQGIPQQVLLCVAALLYGFELYRMVRLVKAESTRALVRLENFYSEGTEGFMHWISRNVYYVAAAGFCSSLLFFTPEIVHIIFLVLFTTGLIYVFVSFLYMVDKYKGVGHAIQQAETLEKESAAPVSGNPVAEPAKTNETTAPEEPLAADSKPSDSGSLVVPRESEFEDKASLTERLLRENLDKWIMNAGYLNQGMTLEELASELMTNRTYLSGYINNTYNCTFKEFIYMLRIEAAIEIMMEDPNISVEDLGTRVGIPSASTFNRQFVKQMGVTPAVWKMSNLQKNG